MKFNFLSICMITLCACNNQQVNKDAEGKKLMDLSREWSKLAAAGDTTEKMFNYWADDAVVMSPGQPPYKGKAAIKEMVMGTTHIPGFKISWEPISADVSESGDLAYMIEQNQITVNDSLGHPITETNKAVTVWKKQADGSWKNVVDIWNAKGEERK
jgi:ketosteroid isomerase-like protein